MKQSEEIVREMRSEWPDRQANMTADLRVDVAGYPVVVKGESARDHLEAVNRDLARLRLDNAHLRAELAALREPAGDALVEVAAEAFHGSDWRDPTLQRMRAVLDAVLPRVRAEERERVAELESALANINRRASPGSADRTFDDCSRDLYWCASEARRVLFPIPPPDAAP